MQDIDWGAPSLELHRKTATLSTQYATTGEELTFQSSNLYVFTAPERLQL